MWLEHLSVEIQTLYRILFFICFLILASPTAQGEEELTFAEKNFAGVSSEEDIRLRKLINESLDVNALKLTQLRQFHEKRLALYQLDEPELAVKIFREALAVVPEYWMKQELAFFLREAGLHDEARRVRRDAIETAQWPYQKVQNSAELVCDLVIAGELVDAAKLLAATKLDFQSYRKEWREDTALFNAYKLAYCDSFLLEAMGKPSDAIQAAKLSHDSALKRLTAQSFSASQKAKNGYFSAFGIAFARYFDLLVDQSLYFEADQLQAAALSGPVSNTALPGRMASEYLYFQGRLRFLQQEFALAEKLASRAEGLAQGLGYGFAAQSRLAKAKLHLDTLIAQRKFAAAAELLGRIDSSLSSGQIAQKYSLGMERGLVQLGQEQFAIAEVTFKSLANSNLLLLGSRSFKTQLYVGLYWVARYRQSVRNFHSPEERLSLLRSLQEAISDIQKNSDNGRYASTGWNRQVVEIIAQAYIDAAGQSGGEEAIEALGVADWLRGGLVQEALSDAAVRVSTGNDALKNLIRRSQDARNEIRGLRSYLAGEVGGAYSPLPVIATAMRDRIDTLEKERVALTEQIKIALPEYDRLVRPVPPSIKEISNKLADDEALLVLQPAQSATYVWAVTKAGVNAFHRSELTPEQLGDWVRALRASLDVAGYFLGQRAPIEHVAAQALYGKLIAPVERVLEGKTHLIVAAGGVLGQIPFGVLETHSSASANTPFTEIPWLIRRFAVTHVPSVASWLAIAKSNKVGMNAEQAFMGWGDPAFSTRSEATANNARQVRRTELTRANRLLDLDLSGKIERGQSAFKYSEIPPLPETRDELLAIARTLGGDVNKDVLLGARATRDSVLAASKSGLLGNKHVLAFATHGLMAGDLPNLTQPALAMAITGSDAQNPLAPLLTLEDVLSLKLNADWVVLSACNTAASDGKAEESLSGLARGFFYAGGSSLLVTHWAVESESATQLTTSTFAHYVANPKARKAESLRQAMLKVMAMPQYGHPAYWAPYALVGDGGR
jgi:CHAT domain-containing protein